ncbi:hypothetical protein PQS90_04010 [Pseudomonas sp. BLCC-B13]|uniref:hypothetical protein n=1 Tax=Pseudomonas sp. BLCC-B13 TaxID=3025314 RepID=UPI00234F08C6|nr:hypothetical protein [Pseudomonas sp. BLCC-B13]MDC7824308.1 hypothetical protein [Pseudomonas sp. BLCC-B13]
MKEQRKYLALRAHIETLLQDGAQIVSRVPFTLRISGHLFRVQHGMLIGNSVAA